MRLALLAPAFLAAAVAAAAAVLALHFLAVGRPPRRLLPTARFVPPTTAVATRLARRPTDRALLLVRAAALLLAGLALAVPVVLPRRAPVARVILADRSRAVRDGGEVAARVRALARPGDVVVAFDSAPARPVTVGAADDGAARAALDSALAPRAAGAWWHAPRGALSPALVAAVRAAATLRERADSLELVILSPLAAEALDAATPALRARWPGRGRVERVAGRDPAPARGAAAVLDAAGRPAGTDDAVAAAAALLGAGAGAPTVRLVRRAAADAADSAWLAAGAAGAPRVLVLWPRDGVPDGWRRLARPDSGAAAVAAGDAVAVGPFARAAAAPAAARVAARWADGLPAATEEPRGAGCVRAVGVAVPDAGDAALSGAFRDVLAALLAPCGAPFALAAPPGAATTLAGAGGLAPAGAFAAPARAPGRWPAWLLAASIALLLAELPLRRRRAAHPAAAEPDAAAPRREAA